MLSATRETIRKKLEIRKDSKRTTTKINSFINYYLIIIRTLTKLTKKKLLNIMKS